MVTEGGLSIPKTDDHIYFMVTFLSILLGLALLVVVSVLLTGVIVFARGGETNRRWANRLMNMRVAAQAVAALILGLIIFLNHH